MATHLAAVSVGKGKRFEIQARRTPTPGPGELLIEVKSVALNPADCLMRDQGILIPTYPAVTGFDVSGLVLEVGENVPIDTAEADHGPVFRPGITCVAAYVAGMWRSWDPDYGAFQERCLVPWQHSVPLPDEAISWNQAATLPVSLEVQLNAWDIMGIPRVGEAVDSTGAHRRTRAQKGEALLVWGASSSVGSMGVQGARLLRDGASSSFAAVYATAGAANHTYVRSLGADRVFDYKDPQIENAIVSAAREDGLRIRHCFLATGELAMCQAVLKAFVAEGDERLNQTAKVASAPVVPADAEDVAGVEVIFVFPALGEEDRLAQFQYWVGTWARENLAKGLIKPSPEPRVVGKGLEAINIGLDILLQGVSCQKLVIEIAE